MDNETKARYDYLERFYESLAHTNDLNQDVIEQLKADAQEESGYVEAVGKTAVLVEYSIRTRVIVDLPQDASIDDETYWERIAEAAQSQIRDYVKTDKYYPYPDDIVELELDTEVPYNPQTDADKVIYNMSIENR